MTQYWIVGNKAEQVFSDAIPGYVSDQDSAYITWRLTNNPSRILTDGELAFVLLNRGANLPTINAAGVTNLGGLVASEKRQLMSLVGINLTSTGTSALDATYSLDNESLVNLTGIYVSIKVGDGLPGEGETFNYPDITGTPHVFDETTFVNFALAAKNYLYALNQAITGNTSLPTRNLTIA